MVQVVKGISLSIDGTPFEPDENGFMTPVEKSDRRYVTLAAAIIGTILVSYRPWSAERVKPLMHANEAWRNKRRTPYRKRR